VIAAASLLSACVSAMLPEMAWVRTDGRKIIDDPLLLRQGKSDMAACNADLDATAPSESAKGCMALKGYALVQKDQAEDLRAAYATAATKQRAAQGELRQPDRF
jgi:hypothetical protein